MTLRLGIENSIIAELFNKMTKGAKTILKRAKIEQTITGNDQIDCATKGYTLVASIDKKNPSYLQTQNKTPKKSSKFHSN